MEVCEIDVYYFMFLHVCTAVGMHDLCVLAHLPALVVQKVNSAIHRINHYPADKHYQSQLNYPADCDLSSG